MPKIMIDKQNASWLEFHFLFCCIEVYVILESMNLVTVNKVLFLPEIYTCVLKHIYENNTFVSVLHKRSTVQNN